MSKTNQIRIEAFQFIKNTTQMVGKEKVFAALQSLPKGHTFKLKQFWECPSSLDFKTLKRIFKNYMYSLAEVTGEFSEDDWFTYYSEAIFDGCFALDALDFEENPILKLILMRHIALTGYVVQAKGNLFLKKFNCEVFVQILGNNVSQLMVREIYPLDALSSYSEDRKYLFGENTHRAIRCFNSIKKLAKRAGFRLPIVAYDNGNLESIRENIEQTGSRFIDRHNIGSFLKELPEPTFKAEA